LRCKQLINLSFDRSIHAGIDPTRTKKLEAEKVGERVINMLRVSPNKDDRNYAEALSNLAETLRRRETLCYCFD
jgi:hypothetical protein